MLRLPESLRAWGGPGFAAALKRELEEAGGAQLPLQHGLAAASVALEDDVQVMPLGAEEQGGCVVARVGVFFSGVVAGCSCADDPTPVEPRNEYCELRIAIDRTTAVATATVAED